MTLRDQILARIDQGANELGYRPPTGADIIRACTGLVATIIDEIWKMVEAKEIDTETGSDGLTYKRAKATYVEPPRKQPAPNNHTGIEYFPSKNAPPKMIQVSAKPQARLTMPCPKIQVIEKREIARQASPPSVKKPPHNRTNHAERALVTQHLTGPMSSAELAQVLKRGQQEVGRMLFNLQRYKFLNGTRGTPKLYFFGAPTDSELHDALARAKTFKRTKRGIDSEKIVQEYLAHKTVAEIAISFDTSRKMVQSILRENGIKYRSKSELVIRANAVKRENLRLENDRLRLENEELKARIQQLQVKPLRHKRIDAFPGESHA